jgi:hypothetical protein
MQCKKCHFVEVENLEKLPIFAMKFHKIIFFYIEEEFGKTKIIIWYPIAEPKKIYICHTIQNMVHMPFYFKL